MLSYRRHRTPLVASAVMLSAAVLLLSACSTDGGTTPLPPGTSDSIVVGTTAMLTSLDPAGSSDPGSHVVQAQVFSQLLGIDPADGTVKPDLAESAEFTAPNDYTVKLKPKLVFANDHELTSSDVLFSFTRLRAINDPNGPASLLDDVGSVEATDDLTVVFHLTVANDQSFPARLATQAGYIVDEEVFSAAALTPAADIVAANAFSGQYVITDYDENRLISFESNDTYVGVAKTPIAQQVDLRYLGLGTDLVPEVRDGSIDVAYGGLSAADLSKASTAHVALVTGAGSDLRSLTFNLSTMPFGAGTAEADPTKALAVRTAIADLLDRPALAKVYGSSFVPAYAYVPSAIAGSKDTLVALYGDKAGGPDGDAASRVLRDAKISGPITISVEFVSDLFGALSAEEFALIKAQLEAGGLFRVTLDSAPWADFQAGVAANAYQAFQTESPVRFADASSVLPSLLAIQGNNYSNADLAGLITAQNVEVDAAKRATDLGAIHDQFAADLPFLPVLQSQQVVFTSPAVKGVVLDSSQTLRFGTLVKRA